MFHAVISIGLAANGPLNGRKLYSIHPEGLTACLYPFWDGRNSAIALPREPDGGGDRRVNMRTIFIQGFYMSSDRTEYQDSDASYASGMAAFEAKNFSQAMRFLSPIAEQGDAEAQHRCAIMYQNGLGVVANEEKAVEMMRAAAEQGHPVAQHGLGFMYMEGECVEQDSLQAIKWFEKAAAQGLVGSLTTLAMMYEEGLGVDKDPEKAKALYKQAGF